MNLIEKCCFGLIKFFLNIVNVVLEKSLNLIFNLGKNLVDGKQSVLNKWLWIMESVSFGYSVILKQNYTSRI